MDILENRRKTFYSWPHEKPAPDDLANNGFYHDPTDRQTDRVSCHLCGVAVYDWQKTDSILERHREAYCDCGYVSLLSNLEFPLNPEARSARRSTFKRWPHRMPFKAIPSRLAEAGFLYAPTNDARDRAKCLYCKIEVQAWKEDQDPLEVHRKMSPNCPFLTEMDRPGVKKPLTVAEFLPANSSEPGDTPQPKARLRRRSQVKLKLTMNSNDPSSSIDHKNATDVKSIKLVSSAKSPGNGTGNPDKSSKSSLGTRPVKRKTESKISEASKPRKLSAPKSKVSGKSKSGIDNPNNTTNGGEHLGSISDSSSLSDPEVLSSSESSDAPKNPSSSKRKKSVSLKRTSTEQTLPSMSSIFTQSIPKLSASTEKNKNDLTSLRNLKDLTTQLDHMKYAFKLNVDALERQILSQNSVPTTNLPPENEMEELRQRLSDYEKTCSSLSMALTQKDSEISRLINTNTFLQNRVELLSKQNERLKRTGSLPTSPPLSNNSPNDGVITRRSSSSLGLTSLENFRFL